MSIIVKSLTLKYGTTSTDTLRYKLISWLHLLSKLTLLCTSCDNPCRPRQISKIGLDDIGQGMWNVVIRRKPQVGRDELQKNLKVEWRVDRCRSVVPAPHGIISGGSSPIKYSMPTSGWSVTVLICKTDATYEVPFARIDTEYQVIQSAPEIAKYGAA